MLQEIVINDFKRLDGKTPTHLIIKSKIEKLADGDSWKGLEYANLVLEKIGLKDGASLTDDEKINKYNYLIRLLNELEPNVNQQSLNKRLGIF